MTGEEALESIWNRHLLYSEPEHPELFNLWWESLPRLMRREIASASENFADAAEYIDKLAGRRSSSIGHQQVVSEESFRAFEDSLPRPSLIEYKTLLGFQRRGTQHREQLAERIRRHVMAYKSALESAFGVQKTRERTEELRDRHWSKWMYELPRQKGQSNYQLIAKRWTETRNEPVTGEQVAKAIKRHRKRRRRLNWALRVWIHKTNFPKIESLTCLRCFGTGEVPHPDSSKEWAEWFNRWNKNEFSGWNPDKNPDPAPHHPNVPVSCPECGGKGRSKTSLHQHSQ